MPDTNKTATQDTPSHGVGPEDAAHAPHGIPPEVHEDEPKGLPTSDRHHGETAPGKPQDGAKE